ncbi:MAG: OprO/OprP family phosphate-selective porin [Prevotella sp.]|nr:OprO/OprP family phosphate-selective porin [Prevotella sp.]
MAQTNQSEKEQKFMPEIHGTIRGKYEYQTEEGEGRFEVRNARISITGKVVPMVSYKAEIDLSDEGKIKMLDAYTRVTPVDRLNFTIGQFRVPFTIDAHRSPHQQYFANRSFIAKQVGNVRDVGATLGYKFKGECPVVLEAGLFNGSGLTDQKDYWTKSVNFSAKAQLFLPKGFNVTLSTQKIKPYDHAVMMYDGGVYWHAKGWHVEAEYLFKHYGGNAFNDVHSFDSFINYDIAVKNKKSIVKKVSPLIRYDMMTDHSDGSSYDDNGKLTITDYKRHRLTGGMTISLATPFVSDIRINYEKYFYRDGAIAKPSEKDKFVIEFMTRF